MPRMGSFMTLSIGCVEVLVVRGPAEGVRGCVAQATNKITPAPNAVHQIAFILTALRDNRRFQTHEKSGSSESLTIPGLG
jgi:hypothetical protein